MHACMLSLLHLLLPVQEHTHTQETHSRSLNGDPIQFLRQRGGKTKTTTATVKTKKKVKSESTRPEATRGETLAESTKRKSIGRACSRFSLVQTSHSSLNVERARVPSGQVCKHEHAFILPWIRFPEHTFEDFWSVFFESLCKCKCFKRLGAFVCACVYSSTKKVNQIEVLCKFKLTKTVQADLRHLHRRRFRQLSKTGQTIRRPGAQAKSVRDLYMQILCDPLLLLLFERFPPSFRKS